jgi:hypothetical protein
MRTSQTIETARSLFSLTAFSAKGISLAVGEEALARS